MQQLLNGLDQRANRILAHVAVLKDSGSNPGIVDRAGALQAEAEAASLPYLIRYAELGLALHQAIGGAEHDLATTITRLQRLTIGGDYRSFTDISCFVDGLPLPSHSATRSAQSEEYVRFAWHQLVQTRRALLGIGDRRPDEGHEPEGDWLGAFTDGPGWLAHKVSRLRGAVRRTQ
ncbi:hypothetical protein ABZ829_32345 [Streptomyces xanthochromogenes]